MECTVGGESGYALAARRNNSLTSFDRILAFGLAGDVEDVEEHPRPLGDAEARARCPEAGEARLRSPLTAKAGPRSLAAGYPR